MEMDRSKLAPADIAHEFAGRINRRSPDAIAELMTDDHVFVDSLGEMRSGRERMQIGWAGYFAMFPDYTVEVDRTLSDGHVVVLLGRARATYAPDGVMREENSWELPAAWRSVVRGGLVAEWQVYADNSPVQEIIARAGGKTGRPDRGLPR